MNKSESKYFHTAHRMQEALLSLLEQKEYPYITVKEVCDRAQVNRSTFYLHYESMTDLLTETLEAIMKRFYEKFHAVNPIDPKRIANAAVDQLIFITPEYLIPFLEFARDNRCVFQVALAQPEIIQVNHLFNRLYSDLFHPIMIRFGLQEYEIDYKLAFYLEGMFAVICRWIKVGCRDEVTVMADLLTRCVFPEEYATVQINGTEK